MESPQTHKWGPALWMILHSSAERIGSAPSKALPHEEERLWTGLLSSLRHSLPCPQCRRHYNDYFSSHPILEISQSFIRNWLFQLHSQVNIRNKKEDILLIDHIPELYSKPFAFSHHTMIVKHQMQLAIFHRMCSRDDIQRTHRFLEEMRHYYALF